MDSVFVDQVAHSNLTKLAAWKTQAALRSDKSGDLRSRTSHGLETGEIKAWFHGNLLTLKEIEKMPRQSAAVSTKSANLRSRRCLLSPERSGVGPYRARSEAEKRHAPGVVYLRKILITWR